METIVLEHKFDSRTFDIERYRKAQRKSEWCSKTHDVHHVVSYLAPDRRRMICVFEAPDAEAVRRTARRLGYSYESVWPATVVR